MDRQTLRINELTSLQQDGNYKQYDTVQALSSNDYILKDFNEIHPNNLNTGTNQPYLNFDDGHGINADLIDEEKREGKLNNFRGDANQLFPRAYLTIPYTGRGKYHVDIDSEIRSANMAGDDRACNSLSGVTIDHQFTPLVPSLKETIQNTKHLIPEDSVADWFRGGVDTTQIRKDIDFFERCLDDEKVRQILTKKKTYLTTEPVIRTDN
tara:strand:- start:407 stop:1036 length:630 start_codon:yes stop_codon:yes gene_type:complete